MKKESAALLVMCITLLFAACAGLPPERIDSPSAVAEISPEIPPEIPVVPRTPELIMGKGIVPVDKLSGFLLMNNPGADPDFVGDLSRYYIEEAAAEGVNHDIAFSQMGLETGFLRFGNLVSIEMNNFAGLGSTGLPGPDGQPERGHSFPDARTGVRAHIQHLKGYASAEPLNLELVNPRYRYLVMLQRIGTSPNIHGLTGTWAMDPQYSEKIITILRRLYEFSF